MQHMGVLRTAVLLLGCCLLIVSIGVGLFGLVGLIDGDGASFGIAGLGYGAVAIAALIDRAAGDSAATSRAGRVLRG